MRLVYPLDIKHELFVCIPRLYVQPYDLVYIKLKTTLCWTDEQLDASYFGAVDPTSPHSLNIVREIDTQFREAIKVRNV
jgi:hypothetical protein